MQFDYFTSQASAITTLTPPAHSWIELSASALAHNVQQFKKLLGQTTALAFVVKANAYGHGIIEISKLADALPDIDFLCTFSLSEALLLRAAQVSKPLLVLAYIDQDPAQAVGKNVAFVVDSIYMIERLAAIAQKQNARLPVHLKIDTGLSRFGICPTRALAIAQQITNSPHLMLQGILTHLSEAQEAASTFTTQQLDIFDAVVTELARNNITPPFIHAANSGASLQHLHRSSCTMVRIGLGLYGFVPAAHISDTLSRTAPALYLKPVLSWKTTIMSLKKVPAQAYIGYNRTHQVVRDTTIALIPVGYSNGFDINLSNRGRVLVDGTPVPILGRVAMNVITVDVTDLPDRAQIGSTVTLLGSVPAVRADTYINALEIKNVRTFLTCLPAAIPRIIVD